MSLKALFTAYVVGGVTLIPLVVSGLLFYTWFTTIPVIPPPSPYDQVEVDSVDVTEEKQPTPVETNDLPRPRKGWLTMRRTFEESTIESYVNLVFSFLDTRTKDPKKSRPKDMWYVALKGTVLYLYQDEQMAECEAAIELSDKDIFIYPEGLGDAELFIKRNAICIKPRTQNTTTGTEVANGATKEVVREKESKSSQADPARRERSKYRTRRKRELAKEGDPWYIFVRSLTEMEDWYLAFIHASNHPAQTPYLAPLLPVFDPSDMNHLVSTLDAQPDVIPTRWLNALLGRIFFTFYKTQMLEDALITRIMKKISRVKRPAFLKDIVVTEVSVGSRPPTLSKPMLKELTKEGDAAIELQFHHKGEFRMTIETTAVFSIGTFRSYEVKLVLAAVFKEMEGNLLIKIKRPPSNRIWYAFTQTPKLDLKVEPIVSDRQITWSVVLVAIEAAFKSIIQDTLVLPNMDDISFSDSMGFQNRGGIWQDAQRGEKQPCPVEPENQTNEERPPVLELLVVDEKIPSGMVTPSELESQISDIPSMDDVHVSASETSPPSPAPEPPSPTVSMSAPAASEPAPVPSLAVASLLTPTPPPVSTPVVAPVAVTASTSVVETLLEASYEEATEPSGKSSRRSSWFSSVRSDDINLRPDLPGSVEQDFNNVSRRRSLDKRKSQEALGRSQSPQAGSRSESQGAKDKKDVLSHSPEFVKRTMPRRFSLKQDHGRNTSTDSSSGVGEVPASPTRSNTLSSTSTFLSTLKSRTTDKQPLSTAKETVRRWGANWGGLKKDQNGEEVDSGSIKAIVSKLRPNSPPTNVANKPQKTTYADLKAAVEERRGRDRSLNRRDEGSERSRSPSPIAIPSDVRKSRRSVSNPRSEGSSSLGSPSATGALSLSSSPAHGRRMSASSHVSHKRNPSGPFPVEEQDESQPMVVHMQPPKAAMMTIPGIHASHRGEVMSMGYNAPPRTPEGKSAMQGMYRLWKIPGASGDQQGLPSEQQTFSSLSLSMESHDVNAAEERNADPLNLSPTSSSPSHPRLIPPPLPPRSTTTPTAVSRSTVQPSSPGSTMVSASETLKNIASKGEVHRRNSVENHAGISLTMTNTKTLATDGINGVAPPLPPRRAQSPEI